MALIDGEELTSQPDFNLHVVSFFPEFGELEMFNMGEVSSISVILQAKLLIYMKLQRQSARPMARRSTRSWDKKSPSFYSLLAIPLTGGGTNENKDRKQSDEEISRYSGPMQ